MEPNEFRKGILGALEFAKNNPAVVLEREIVDEQIHRIRNNRVIQEGDDVFLNEYKYRSANIAAFNIGIHALHNIINEEERIGLVIHDEQKEFDKQLRNAFQLTSRVKVKMPAFQYPTASTANTFSGNIEFRDGKNTVGLQLVDITTWMVKRVFDNGDKPRDNCALLYNTIQSRASINGFWLEELIIRLGTMIKEREGGN